ncbi:hypothetical protein VTO73DRAFT_8451 [Trametes versicolor]
MFMANLAAIVLLVLVTFSTPFIGAFYFLRTDFAGGIKFGLLGFCNDLTGTCTAKALGYHHEPQITNPLTTVLVLYPVAAGLTLLGALILIPAIFSGRDRGYPYVLFALLSTFAFLACAGGFGVTMYLFTVARDRFHAEGFSASYGPSVWIALSATALLLFIALNAGCGTCMGGRLGRQARHLVYTY